jgi:hypothetical protein
MNIHNKTFLMPDNQFRDTYVSFYFADNDHGFLNSEFTIGDSGNVVCFNGDTEEDLKALDSLLVALKTFRDIAAGRQASKRS